MPLHVKASRRGRMGEPGATAGASLTASNTLDSFAAHLAAEEQACAQQRPRSSLVITFVSGLNYISINYRQKQEEAACLEGPNQLSPVKDWLQEKGSIPYIWNCMEPPWRETQHQNYRWQNKNGNCDCL